MPHWDDTCGTYTTGGKVTGHPPPVSITLLLEGEHRLVGVAEGEVQGLGGEVTDDVGGVATPQRGHALVLDGTAEALADAVVLAVETTTPEHLILCWEAGSALREGSETEDGGVSGGDRPS